MNMDMNILSEYLLRVNNDDCARQCRHVYFFSHQRESEISMFNERVLFDILSSDTAIYLLDSKPGLSGCRGFEAIRATLLSVGFPKDRIHPISFVATDMINTYTEAQRVVEYFRENDIVTYAICSPPFHLPRAYNSIVSHIDRETVTVYALPGLAIDWDETIHHSQGITIGTRKTLVHSEVERIYQYNLKGDLLNLDEVLEYMSARKNINITRSRSKVPYSVPLCSLCHREMYRLLSDGDGEDGLSTYVNMLTPEQRAIYEIDPDRDTGINQVNHTMSPDYGSVSPTFNSDSAKVDSWYCGTCHEDGRWSMCAVCCGEPCILYTVSSYTKNGCVKRAGDQFVHCEHDSWRKGDCLDELYVFDLLIDQVTENMDLPKGVHPTGPDGGFGMSMKCRKCESIYTGLTDK